MTTGTGCAWSATANVPWLSITAGASGTGNGTVQFSVAANTDPTPRAGTLTVAGQTFTVNQAAASVSCSYLAVVDERVRSRGGRLGQRGHHHDVVVRVDGGRERVLAHDHQRGGAAPATRQCCSRSPRTPTRLHAQAR